MMQEDYELREAIRQSRPAGAGNRLAAAAGGQPSQGLGSTATRIDSAGQVRRLFIPDTDPLDNASFYLGDEDARQL